MESGCSNDTWKPHLTLITPPSLITARTRHTAISAIPAWRLRLTNFAIRNGCSRRWWIGWKNLRRREQIYIAGNIKAGSPCQAQVNLLPCWVGDSSLTDDLVLGWE